LLLHSSTDAIAREKQLKNWQREWKDKLINDNNPEWKDLSEEIGVTAEMIKSVKKYYQGIAGQARNDARQREMRQLESDFDKAIKQLTQKSGN
jgi:7-keto-8-aminopelargonate synthetase-like enzyme